MSFEKKYLKYKKKYLDLKKQIGGSDPSSPGTPRGYHDQDYDDPPTPDSYYEYLALELIRSGLLNNLNILLTLDEFRVLNQLDFETISDLFNFMGNKDLSKWKDILNSEYIWGRIINTETMYEWIDDNYNK
jgi:hypothetical protein